MDVCKCIEPQRHGGTLYSRRATSLLVKLVDGERDVCVFNDLLNSCASLWERAPQFEKRRSKITGKGYILEEWDDNCNCRSNTEAVSVSLRLSFTSLFLVRYCHSILLYYKAVGSKVGRVSDSRPEGLGSTSDAKVHTEYMLVKSVGLKVLWEVAAKTTLAGCWRIFSSVRAHA
ncbi:hypothetical protein TNCV_2666651 [Trichonephila clavipes]|nr:hypothetical protein TNCV_2666651 [Trichonephila clavipes]